MLLSLSYTTRLYNRNKDFEDKGIDIFGPYNMSVKSDFQKFEDSLDLDHLFKNLSNIENETTLRNSIVGMIRTNIKLLKKEPVNNIYLNGVFTKDCFSRIMSSG